jgi:hypothetical protein
VSSETAWCDLEDKDIIPYIARQKQRQQTHTYIYIQRDWQIKVGRHLNTSLYHWSSSLFIGSDLSPYITSHFIWWNHPSPVFFKCVGSVCMMLPRGQEHNFFDRQTERQTGSKQKGRKYIDRQMDRKIHRYITITVITLPLHRDRSLRTIHCI